MRLHTTHGLVSLSLSRGERLAERLAGVWPLPMVRLAQPGPHGERLRICFQVGAREVDCLLCELPPEPEDYADGVLALLIEALQDALRSVASMRLRGFLVPCASIRETEQGVVIGLALFLPGESLERHRVSALCDTYLAKFATSVAGAQLPPFVSRRVVPRLAAGAIRLDTALVDGQPLLLALPLPGDTVEAIAFDAIESWAEFGLREIAWAPAVPQELSEEQAAALRGDGPDAVEDEDHPGDEDEPDETVVVNAAGLHDTAGIDDAAAHPRDDRGLSWTEDEFDAPPAPSDDDGRAPAARHAAAHAVSGPMNRAAAEFIADAEHELGLDDHDDHDDDGPDGQPPPAPTFITAREIELLGGYEGDGSDALPDHWPNTRASGGLASAGGAAAERPGRVDPASVDAALLLDADLDLGHDPDARRDLEEAIAVEVTLDDDLDAELDDDLHPDPASESDADLEPAEGAGVEADSADDTVIVDTVLVNSGVVGTGVGKDVDVDVDDEVASELDDDLEFATDDVADDAPMRLVSVPAAAPRATDGLDDETLHDLPDALPDDADAAVMVDRGDSGFDVTEHGQGRRVWTPTVASIAPATAPAGPIPRGPSAQLEAEAAAMPSLDPIEVESWISPMQRHAFGRLVRIGPDAFVGEMISAAVLALVEAGRGEDVTDALGPVDAGSVAMPGFLGVEQLIRGADGVTTALAVRVAGGLDCHRLTAAASRLRGGAGRLVVVDLIERPEIDLPSWTLLPLARLRPMFAAAASVPGEGAAVFAAWLGFVDAWVQLGACATAAVRGDARLLREPLRSIELLHGFERRLLFGVVDVVAAQLAVHGVPIVAQLPQLPQSVAAGRTEPCVVVIDEVVESRSALELAIVDPSVGFASGVRWRSGSLQLFADVLQRERHGVAVASSGTARRNDFLNGLADLLGVARTTITDLPTATSRAINLGRSDLFTGAARSALIGRCIETLWVLWERHGELRAQAATAAEMLRDANESRR